MQVILLDKVVNLGDLGEIVKVKDGYARNFLIPQKLARRATEANKAEFEAKRVELEKAAAAKLAEIAGPGRKARRHHRQADPEGRRRRPPVRLGHQLRHRRRAGQARLQGRQGPGAHAQRPDQARWRFHRQRRAAHRRRGRHHRDGLRRNRLSQNPAPIKRKAACGRLFLCAVVLPSCPPAIHSFSRAVHRKRAGFAQPLHWTSTRPRRSIDHSSRGLMSAVLTPARRRIFTRSPDRAAAHPAAFHRGRIQRAGRPAAGQPCLGPRGRPAHRQRLLPLRAPPDLRRHRRPDQRHASRPT